MKRHIQKYHFICVACTTAFSSHPEVEQHLKECSRDKRFRKIDLSFTEMFRNSSSGAFNEVNASEPDLSQDDSGFSATGDSDSTLETSASSSRSFFDSSFNPKLWSFPNPFLLQLAAKIQKQITSEPETKLSDKLVDGQPEEPGVNQEIVASHDPLEIARTVVFLRVLQIAGLRMMLRGNSDAADQETEAIKQEAGKPLEDIGRKLECANSVKASNRNLEAELDSDSKTTEVEEEADRGSNNCSKCDETFPSSFTFKIHMKRVHNKRFKCSECFKKFTHQSNLSAHHKRKHLKEKFVCKDCDISFCNSFSLVDHVRGIHEKSQSFDCHKCELIFLTRKAFYKHKYSEHSDKRWTCDFCKAELKSKSQLERHELKFHG